MFRSANGHIRCLLYVLLINMGQDSGLIVAASADLNYDGYVDYQDFAIMASQWLTREVSEDPKRIPLVDIPAGTFEMGDHYDVPINRFGPFFLKSSDEKPVHVVSLDRFTMSKYEITNAQYATYLNSAIADGSIEFDKLAAGAKGELYIFFNAGSVGSQLELSHGEVTVRSRDSLIMDDHPVTAVTWQGAKAFCDYYGYRLPTEAEWEYAARGGQYDPYYQYPWGSNSIDCSYANYRNGNACNPLELAYAPHTTPVGYYGPQGGFSLCDMSGNVAEWCEDWYDPNYYSKSPNENPQGPSEGAWVCVRGGSYRQSAFECRTAARSLQYVLSEPRPRGQLSHIGFRVCLQSSIHDGEDKRQGSQSEDH